jgi:hypothetical protein
MAHLILGQFGSEAAVHADVTTYYFKARPGTAHFENEYRSWRDGAARPEVGVSRTLADAAIAAVARVDHEQKLANPETRLAKKGNK